MDRVTRGHPGCALKRKTNILAHSVLSLKRPSRVTARAAGAHFRGAVSSLMASFSCVFPLFQELRVAFMMPNPGGPDDC